MSLRLSVAEIVELTGGLRQPRSQIKALHEAGFWRARLVRGEAILERAHYEAVCSGALPPVAPVTSAERPMLKSERLALAKA